MLKIKLFEQNC